MLLENIEGHFCQILQRRGAGIGSLPNLPNLSRKNLPPRHGEFQQGKNGVGLPSIQRYSVNSLGFFFCKTGGRLIFASPILGKKNIKNKHWHISLETCEHQGDFPWSKKRSEHSTHEGNTTMSVWVMPFAVFLRRVVEEKTVLVGELERQGSAERIMASPSFV
ncbi:MAG: hypothetical protein IPM82_31090 [Saprospiraceae bacterium]|nr:hypothetical protein [Saprospiraceae bacterium]